MKYVKLNACLYNNVGDDLMVETLLNRYPQYMFFYDGQYYEASNRFLKNHNFLNLYSIYQKYGRINHILNLLTLYLFEDFFYKWIIRRTRRKCVCSVNIGGSIYMEKEGEEISHRIEREEVKQAGLPVFVIGANFGPYENKCFLERFREFFSRCEGVCFRDRASFDMFSELACVKWAPDVVFSYPLSENCNVEDNDTVIISVMNFRRRKDLAQYAESYEELMVRFCETCVTAGKTPILVAFCEYEGDFEAAERIHSMLKHEFKKTTRKVLYKETAEILTLFRNADYVLATRFHAMILALKFKKRFFSIAYSSKIRNVLDDIGCFEYCLPNQIGQICVADLLSKKSIYNIDSYLEEANTQFSQFEKYMIQ